MGSSLKKARNGQESGTTANLSTDNSANYNTDDSHAHHSKQQAVEPVLVLRAHKESTEAVTLTGVYPLRNSGEVIEDAFPSVNEVCLSHEKMNRAMATQVAAYDLWKRESSERPQKELAVLQAECDKLDLSVDEQQLYIFNQKKIKEEERLRKCQRDYMNKAVISISQSTKEDTVYVPNVNEGIARQVSQYSLIDSGVCRL